MNNQPGLSSNNEYQPVPKQHRDYLENQFENERMQVPNIQINSPVRVRRDSSSGSSPSKVPVYGVRKESSSRTDSVSDDDENFLSTIQSMSRGNSRRDRSPRGRRSRSPRGRRERSPGPEIEMRNIQNRIRDLTNHQRQLQSELDSINRELYQARQEEIELLTQTQQQQYQRGGNAKRNKKQKTKITLKNKN